MHCAHCGKEIGDKHKCSCCGSAQHSDDLFAVLGDLGPNTNDGRMESVVNEPIASITYGDYFSELGDIPTNEDYSPIMQADNTASENVSSTDPFHRNSAALELSHPHRTAVWECVLVKLKRVG